MNKLLTLLILCTLSLALFSGCEKEVKVLGIIVEPKNVCLSKGDVVQLTYLVTPYSADNKSVRWESKDDAIATVSQTGLVTAIAEGKTQIIATTKDGHYSDTVSVTVFGNSSPTGDSIALVKLNEIATNLPYWNFSQPMETWEGVVLNAERRVVSIYYDYEISISKPLDASIGNLSCLKSLSLSKKFYAIDNFIIPSEIGMLSELQELKLFYGFSGAIPPELGNLKQLEGLFLYQNSFTGGIPKELGNLSNLNYLVIGDCQLTGNIPEELGKLDKLEHLILNDNQLTGEIPQKLENLRMLYNLGLSYNSLSGKIPESLLSRFSEDSFCPQNGTKFDNLDCYK